MPHDTDRTQLEFGSELFEYGEVPEFASEQYESSGALGSILGSIFGEAQAEGAFEGGYQEYHEYQEYQEYHEYQEYQELPEIMHDELASELLEVRTDQELDHFLGSLFKKVAGGIGKVIKSPVGQALGGILKTVAKKALPIAGGALGTFVGGPLGGMVGSKLADMAGNAFGLEYEGLSPEDRDFEVVQTLNAISRRFQNLRGAGERDPMMRFDIDPLRRLNSLLWGYVQDEQHRLTVVRRAYEYNHEYGLALEGKALRTLRPSDSRSKFLEAFHNCRLN